jgi:PAS domain S-box-containing protein
MFSLRNKTYLVILGLSVIFFVFAYGTVWFVTEKDMKTLQETEARNNSALVERVLKNEINNLAIKQSDWARWDDTYEFISDKNQSYIISNLNDESLRLLGVDVMVFINNGGDVVYAKQIFADGTSEESLPRSLETYVTGRGALLDFTDLVSVKNGLLTTTDATWMVASQPITTSDGQGARRGTIVFARYLTDRYSETLSALSGYTVHIAPYDARQVSGDNPLAKLTPPDSFALEYKGQEVVSYQVIKNIFNNPSLILEVRQQASIVKQGESFLWRNLWYSLFVLVTYVSILVAAIDMFLLRRVENMRRIAHKVAVMQEGTIPEGDIDDFSYLATVMVSALKKVNQSDSMALGSRNEMEKFKMIIDQSLDHTIITDADGKIVYANPAAEKMTGYSFQEMKNDTPRIWGRQMPSEFYQKMWETIRLKKETFEGELINKRKDGTRYRAYARITPILDEKKRILYYIGNEHFLRKEAS